MHNLLKYIRSLTDFSEDSWEKLQGVLYARDFKKNEFILKEGQICKALYYIQHGYCRSYYEIEGVVKNTGFFFENEIVTNVKSFGNEQPSAFNIIACEGLQVIIFDRQKLFEAAKHTPEIETLGRHCIRQFATRQEEIARIFQLYTAQERLEYIEKHHPIFLQRISLTQLSSFLGVARETLSRIRRRRVSARVL
jgi:CRP-like cAMP-binding protein